MYALTCVNTHCFTSASCISIYWHMSTSANHFAAWNVLWEDDWFSLKGKYGWYFALSSSCLCRPIYVSLHIFIQLGCVLCSLTYLPPPHYVFRHRNDLLEALPCCSIAAQKCIPLLNINLSFPLRKMAPMLFPHAHVYPQNNHVMEVYTWFWPNKDSWYILCSQRFVWSESSTHFQSQH